MRALSAALRAALRSRLSSALARFARLSPLDILDTTLREPGELTTDPVIIEDLHATIYKAMGISPKLAYEVEKRPFYVTRDGLGKPIESLYG